MTEMVNKIALFLCSVSLLEFASITKCNKMPNAGGLIAVLNVSMNNGSDMQ